MNGPPTRSRNLNGRAIIINGNFPVERSITQQYGRSPLNGFDLCSGAGKTVVPHSAAVHAKTLRKRCQAEPSAQPPAVNPQWNNVTAFWKIIVAAS